jgi:hypothetical protein
LQLDEIRLTRRRVKKFLTAAAQNIFDGEVRRKFHHWNTEEISPHHSAKIAVELVGRVCRSNDDLPSWSLQLTGYNFSQGTSMTRTAM